ncbi:hypothetical protein KIW84_054702 [Lathyrus oleraceus]|uniref:Uncharacterized protein n=1 Tax=Pisum sativum TaxID=3888 RepID=A0A9D4WWI6_PEA|nr:hypothetical protein KIW84_054702 [Pisum sativum]
MKYTICFLKGLNDNFNHVKSQILMVEPLPNVTKVFSSILQQERQLTSLITYESSKVLMRNTKTSKVNGIFHQKQGKGRSKPSFQGKTAFNSKVCSFCGKIGNTLHTCYFKHGFSPGFRFGFSNNIDPCDEAHSLASNNVEHPTNKVDITPDMYNKLIALLNKIEPSPDSDLHIIHVSSSGLIHPSIHVKGTP